MSKPTNKQIEMGYNAREHSLYIQGCVEVAKNYIKDAKPDVIWYWKQDDPFKEGGSLDTSFDNFVFKGFRTDENDILRFCSEEIRDLWDGFPDDTLEKRQSHCACLYQYIKNRLSNKQ